MSRIATVQKALENILLHVNKNNIDISVVFFNHSHQVFSTIPFTSERTLTGSLSVDELIKRINEIICFGSTEFSQIKLALEKLKKKCLVNIKKLMQRKKKTKSVAKKEKKSIN